MIRFVSAQLVLCEIVSVGILAIAAFPQLCHGQTPQVPSSRQSSASPMTLNQVLQQARRHNAALPAARLELQAAAEAVREARARLWPQLALNGGVDAAYVPAYGANDGVIQAVGRETLYDGGLLRAHIQIASANERGLRAGFRMQQKDLDLAVESGYYDLVEADAEMGFRQQAVQRLRDYLTGLRERKAAGEGITSAVL